MNPVYRVTAGIVFLLAVIAILLSMPGTLITEGISIIDVELRTTGRSHLPVRAKMDLGSKEHMRSFPNVVGYWNGIHDYDWSRFQEYTGADVMLCRAYTQDALYQPVFFEIVQSKDIWSFHPPPICYEVMGFQLEKQGGVQVPIPDSAWAETWWRSEREGNIFKGNISAIVLTMHRNNATGDITERRIAMYYYVRDSAPLAKNSTRIQVSTIAPVGLSDDSVLNLLKDFMGETFPLMFEPGYEKEEVMLAVQLIHNYGALGWFIITLMLAAPMVPILLSIERLRSRK